MVYADFSFYTDSFLGAIISEGEFPRLALRASRFLDYYTMGKAKNAPDIEELKMACCAIAEKYQAIDKAQSIAMENLNEPGGIKSESVGSYSVSYQTAGEKAQSAANTAEIAKNSLASVAREYLAGTGLLYRGGRCCGCTLPTL